MEQRLAQAAEQVNKTLAEKTHGWYFVRPSVRALKWFKHYYITKIHGENAGYSISRTDARWALAGYGLDLDAMLAEVGL